MESVSPQGNLCCVSCALFLSNRRGGETANAGDLKSLSIGLEGSIPSSAISEKEQIMTCEWQDKISKEAKENNECDCIRDWYEGHLWECKHVGKEESCKDYSER